MSLLIDALRQAEQAHDGTSSSDKPSSTPLASSLTLQEISRPASTKAQSQPQASPSPSPSSSHKIAPGHTPTYAPMAKPAKPSPKNLSIIAVALVVLFAGMGILWWRSTPSSPQKKLESSPTTSGLINPAQNSSSMPGSQALLSEEARNHALPEMTTTGSDRNIQNRRDIPPPDRGLSQTGTSTPLHTYSHSERTLEESLEKAEKIPFKLQRNHMNDQETKNPDQQAFDAYAEGNFTQAKQLYREILDKDPLSTNALAGLGMIAAQANHHGEALQYFREALAADPKNAFARAQLLGMASETDPLGAESQLQTLLAEQPEAASAHFVLGNLYAGQQRWKEAQQAYFSAHTQDSTNPDILYNLAISLEHLRQPRLAQQFYEQAAEATQKRVAGFAPDNARQRAKQISPAPLAEEWSR